jgi:ferrochelatase
MTENKTAILLMNVGSPDQPEVPQVRKYLTQFLNDKRVIDLPWLLRKFLVNAIIIPFRVKKSTGLYKQLWTKSGSPLIYYSEQLKEKVQQHVKDNADVFVGMRYGNPSIKNALLAIKKAGYQQIVLLPLFPHFAMSTTETALVEAKKQIKALHIDAQIYEVNQFYNHPKFISAFVRQAQKYDVSSFDHIVFSYHGLPNRHVEKCHPGITVNACNCQQKMPDHGKFCYRATSFATTRLIAQQLNLSSKDYSTAFQSRLSKNWLEPFTDDVLMQKLKEGKKNILVLAPSFVTDCLETILEIGVEYGEEFRENGGNQLQLVESLNTEDSWVETLADLIHESLNETN